MHDPLSDGAARGTEQRASSEQAASPNVQPTDALFAFAPALHRDLAGAPPRCLRCGYILERLTTPRCPECGLPFNPLMHDTFTRAPAYVRWKYWLPGWLTAVALGGGVCIWFLAYGIVGWGLTLGAPLALGALLGYGSRGGVIRGTLLTLAGVIFVVTWMYTFNFTGPLCSVILAILFLMPALVGVGIGKSVKAAMKEVAFVRPAVSPAGHRIPSDPRRLPRSRALDALSPRARDGRDVAGVGRPACRRLARRPVSREDHRP